MEDRDEGEERLNTEWDKDQEVGDEAPGRRKTEPKERLKYQPDPGEGDRAHNSGIQLNPLPQVDALPRGRPTLTPALQMVCLTVAFWTKMFENPVVRASEM